MNGSDFCDKPKVDLDPVVVDQLLYHASYYPQDAYNIHIDTRYMIIDQYYRSLLKNTMCGLMLNVRNILHCQITAMCSLQK